MLCALALVLASVAPVDERLVLQAPNLNGHLGLLRTTSALIGDTGSGSVGLSSRLFFLPDFILPGVADANTFVEGNVVAGFGLFNLVELAVQSRAAANLNSARVQPASSVGDTSLGLKAGYSFGLVAAAAHYRAGLATRANKVGFDLENIASTFGADVTFDLTTISVPVRLHLNGMYTAQSGQKAGEREEKFLFDGADGALLALATQQWFFDRAGGGLGVEVTLPYVTPFVEAWYQAAVLAPDYDLANDAWLIITPGVRAGFGGLRIDAAVDLGLTGNAGGAAPSDKDVFDGQPLNPLWAVRLGVSHSFDLAGGGGGFERLEGCVVDERGPVKDAVVAVAVDGRPGPRLLADADGCFSAPIPPGAWTVTVSDLDHAPVSAPVVAGTRAAIALVSQPRNGRLSGFVTTKEDEPIEAALTVTENGVTRDLGSTAGGAFDADVRAGNVVVVARANGYLLQAVRAHIDLGGRETRTLVMRKVPKKRTATLQPDKVETSARVPFEFKKPRLQSTAEYLLDEVVDLLLANPGLRLSIEAHTDPSEIADPSEAKILTEARARTVKDAIVERGVDGARLETAGYGLTQPLAPNDPKNRRIEFVVVK